MFSDFVPIEKCKEIRSGWFGASQFKGNITQKSNEVGYSGKELCCKLPWSDCGRSNLAVSVNSWEGLVSLRVDFGGASETLGELVQKGPPTDSDALVWGEALHFLFLKQASQLILRNIVKNSL